MKCGTVHSLTRGVLDERGSITIEFVVMFPLLLAALAFSFEFGRLFLAHQDVVTNVRDAARYLSRTTLSDQQLAVADNIIRTGLPAGGVEPDWMTDASVVIDTDHATFSSDDFSSGGQVVRVAVTVDFPLAIFDLAGNDRTAIPFVVVDDVRLIGD